MASEAFSNRDGGIYIEDGTMWQLLDSNCFAEHFPYPDDETSMVPSIPAIRVNR